MRIRASLFLAAAAAVTLLLPAALAIKLQLDSTPEEIRPPAAADAAAATAATAAEALGPAAVAQKQYESEIAAAEAQLSAEDAAAGAEPAAAKRFAAAAAAADAAADVEQQDKAAAAAAAAAAGQKEEELSSSFSLFAPRHFRFVDEGGRRALSVFFHNSFEPFDKLSCSDLRENPSLCVEHPRCSVNPFAAAASAAAAEKEDSAAFQEQQPSCQLSKGYLSLAASGALCHLTAAPAAAAAAGEGGEGAQPVLVGEGEMQAVVSDLLRELAVEWDPLLEALKATDAADAESLCELAQELSAEVLATERNTSLLDPASYSNASAFEDSLVADLLASSLGFVAGGNQTPGLANLSRTISPKRHNQVASDLDRQTPPSATLLRASSEGTGEARIRIGINGFGRIGRLVFRIASSRPDMTVTHINSSMSPEYLAYMLRYDSAHGRFDGSVEVRDGSLFVNGRKIHLTADRDPKNINWQESGTDFVCESTGAFCTLQGAGQHVERPGGARHVIISAPAKDEETPTLVVGVNAEAAYTPEMRVVSCASCTTNGLAPLVKVIDSNFGIEEGLMTTVHAVTGTQRVVDMSSNKDWRGGRAAGFNIIPSATGAAKAVARCLPQMKGKLTGMAFRVPTIDVSVVDLTCRLKKSTSYEEIKAAVKAAAEGEMKGILGYTEEAVVSSDILGSECSSVFDANAGIMLNPNFVKLVSWYDNEYAYSARLVDLIAIMAAKDGIVPQGTGLQRKPF